jgi:hypothetical protein
MAPALIVACASMILLHASGTAVATLSPYDINFSQNSTNSTLWWSCTAFEFPEMVTDDIFGLGAPTTNCPRVFDCSMSYCQCISGSLGLRDEFFVCENATATQDTVGSCTRQRSVCLLLAGLNAAAQASSGPCHDWGQRVQLQYARWTVRLSTTALFTSCVFGACSTIAQAFTTNTSSPMLVTGNFTVQDVESMCNFTFASGEFHSALAMNGTCQPIAQATLLPPVAASSTCPAVQSCLAVFCNCFTGGLNASACGDVSTIADAIRLSVVNASTYDACVPHYFNCVTSAAINNTVAIVNAGNLAASSEECALWSLQAVQDYSLRLYQPLGSAAVSEVIGLERANCLSSACALLTNASDFNETTPGREASCAVFEDTTRGPELPFPYPDGAYCPNILPPSSPFAPLLGIGSVNCSLINVCSRASLCACLAGDSTLTECNPLWYRSQSVERWRTCSASVVNCLVNLVYNTSVDIAAGGLECTTWANSLKSAYSNFYYASNKQDSTLFSDCSALGCMFLRRHRPLALLAPDVDSVFCSFTNVSLVPPRLPCSDYTCPDGSCARTPQGCACSVNATLLEATVVLPSASASLQTVRTLVFGTAIAARVTALYRVPGGVACGNFDFSAYLNYSWMLTPVVSGSNPSASGLSIVVNGSSSATFASSLLQRNGWYNLLVRVVTFVPQRDVVLSYTFQIVDPTPIASIVVGGTTRRVSSRGFYISALVQDIFLDTSAFSWSCSNLSDTSALCPVNLSYALVSSGNISGVTVPGFIPAGTWNIMFTYKTITSTLLLTVVDMIIPVTQIIIGGSPVYNTNYFMPTQTIPLASAVSYEIGGLFSYLWTVNGIATATTSTLQLPAGSLLRTSSSLLAAAVPNVITLTATSTTNAQAYGQATVIVYVAQMPSLAILNLTNRFLPNQSSAVALTDSLSVLIASNVVNGTAVTFGQTATLQTSYYAVRSGTKLVKTPLFTTTFDVDYDLGTITRTIVETPLPNTMSTSTSVIFTVELAINNIVISAANRSFQVVLPPLAAATTTQTTLLATLTDAISAAPTIANLATLMQLTTTLTSVTSIATTLLGSMTSNVVNPSQIPADIQGVYLSALTSIVSVLSSNISSTVATQMTSVVNVLVADASFSAADNAQGALEVLGALPVTLVITVATTLTDRVVEGTEPGSSMTFASGSLTIAVRQEMASSFSSAVLQSTSAELAVPSGFQFPGTTPSSTSRVAVAVTETTSSPYPSSSVSGAMTSSTVNFRLLVNNVGIPVSNLAVPLVFNIKTTAPNRAACWYYNTLTGSWSQEGVRVVGVTGDEVTCTTSHLTSFGAFSTGSAAMHVALSSMVVLLAAALQMLV